MVAVVLAAALLGQGALSMTTLARGGASRVVEPKEVVVRTAPEWEALWRAHAGSDTGRPAVEFPAQMVVGVFLGARQTGGYAVTITGVTLEDGTLVVRYAETAPGPDAIVAQVLTAPYHLVRVDRVEGPVRFERTLTVKR
jgi:hypothetical protein